MLCTEAGLLSSSDNKALLSAWSLIYSSVTPLQRKLTFNAWRCLKCAVGVLQEISTHLGECLQLLYHCPVLYRLTRMKMCEETWCGEPGCDIAKPCHVDEKGG